MNFDMDAAVVAPFRMQPGLRRLAPGAVHLTPLRPGSRHQREKLAVLSAFASQAMVCAAGFDARPGLHRVCEQAAQEQGDPTLDVEQPNPTHAEPSPFSQ